MIPIAKFCLYLHKIFRRFRFAETATPFFGLRRTQENDGYDKENSAFSTSGNGAEEPALPNETTIENEHRNMANSTTPKKRLVASFRNLPSEIQEAIKQKYPLGFSEAMMRIDKPNGEFFYAVPFETDEINYLVKIDVKIDDRAEDDEDKDYYDDDIKGADDLQDDDNSGDDEDRDDM